jgi:hypothetical protein
MDSLTSLVDFVKAKDDYQPPFGFDTSILSNSSVAWFLTGQPILHLDPWLHYSWGVGKFMKPVASLSYEVQMATGVSSAIITNAVDLKRQIKEGSNDASIVLFEESLLPMNVQYMMHTAEAYRYSTLIYLHQAVLEGFGNEIQRLARETLIHLSSGPAVSTMTFAQIYPLSIAGCEMTGVKEREWVKDRGAAMIARMRVKNVTKCWDITQEVWMRRDAHCEWKNYNGVVTQLMDPEFSVKGQLHWAQVIKDWVCEVSF